MLSALECELFEASRLLKLHLLELALVIFVSLADEPLQELTQLQVAHLMTACLVNLIIVFGRLDYLLGLPINE